MLAPVVGIKYLVMWRLKVIHYAIQWKASDNSWHTEPKRMVTPEEARVALSDHLVLFPNISARVVRIEHTVTPLTNEDIKQ
jgi:hypothetical protein